MFSRIIAIGVLAACLLVGSVSANPDPCNVNTPQAYTTDSYKINNFGLETINFDDVAQLGGLGNIVKITQIKVFRHTKTVGFALYRIISRICTTYRLREGEPKEMCNGKVGGFQEGELGTIAFGDGVYLKKVELYIGQFVDWIRFIDTNGNSVQMVDADNGLKDKAPTHTLMKDKGVALAFMGFTTRDNVGFPDTGFDRIYAHFDEYRTEARTMATPIFQDNTAPRTTDNVSSTKSFVNDNLAGNIERTIEVTLSETVETSETTTVSNEVGVEVSLETGASFGVEIEAVFNIGVETTLFVGTSFTTTTENSSSKTLSTTVEHTVPVTAKPFTKTTVLLEYSTVEYDLKWSSPVRCSYTFDPKTVTTGVDVTGTVVGKQAIDQAYFRFIDESNPTPTPTLRPTLAPVAGPGPGPGPSPSLCFSSANTVLVQGKRAAVPIEDVQVGNYVQSSQTGYEFSRVISLAHKDDTSHGEYLQITAGMSVIEISPQHMLYMLDKASVAKDIKVGDILSNNQQVTKIKSLKRRGLYAPLTESGTIVVSGVQASTYVAFFDLDADWQAEYYHALLAPLRFVCDWNIKYCQGETHTDGISNVVYKLVQVASFVGGLAKSTQFALVAISSPVVFSFSFIEWLFKVHVVLSVAGALIGYHAVSGLKSGNAKKLKTELSSTVGRGGEGYSALIYRNGAT